MPSKSLPLIAALSLTAAGLFTSPPAAAQDRPLRVELSRTDLAGTSGTEVVIAKIKLPPGVRVPRHFHHGDAYAYIVKGGKVQPKGKDVREDKAGTLFHFRRGELHGDFVVVGDTAIEILSISIVDKGKPLVDTGKP